MKNENRALSQDPWFWIPLAVGGIIALGVGGTILAKNYYQLSVCYEPECFNYLFELFKLPMSILTAGLTLSGFRAVVFRSRQTKLQIDEIMAQNTFSSFLEHKEQFKLLIQTIEKQSEGHITFPDFELLYSKLFPKNSPISFTPHSDSLKEMIMLDYTNIVSILNKLLTKCDETPD